MWSRGCAIAASGQGCCATTWYVLKRDRQQQMKRIRFAACPRVETSRFHSLSQVVCAPCRCRFMRTTSSSCSQLPLAGTFRSHAFRIPDDEYGRALDCLVKACCDVIVTVADEPFEAQSPLQEKIFLGRRQVEPQPDWWFIGGRMCASTVVLLQIIFLSISAGCPVKLRRRRVCDI